MNRDSEIEIPETLMPTILKKAQQPVVNKANLRGKNN